MMIISVSFHRPIQVGSETLTHWSANSKGSTMRVEESDRGIVLRLGRLNGPDNFVLSGIEVLVPWINVDCVGKRADNSDAPDLGTPTRSRTRTRLPQEIADAE